MDAPGHGKGGGRRPVSPMQRAELEVRWVQGFINRKVGFVESRTLCYPSGNYIVFINIETKERSLLRCQNGSIGAFAVSGNQHVVAFSDRQLNPSINIYSYPGLKKQAKLRGRHLS
ncbi:hypothetical protein lerEdw1_007911 [Lerista edwardsae]|nr:hypothetical protein lerEdw1_007911 [Lerista edwardsae]